MLSKKEDLRDIMVSMRGKDISTFLLLISSRRSQQLLKQARKIGVIATPFSWLALNLVSVCQWYLLSIILKGTSNWGPRLWVSVVSGAEFSVYINEKVGQKIMLPVIKLDLQIPLLQFYKKSIATKYYLHFAIIFAKLNAYNTIFKLLENWLINYNLVLVIFHNYYLG